MQREDWNRGYEDAGEFQPAGPDDLLVGELDGLGPGLALDLGCGNGANSVWLAQDGWQVTGVDWAEAAIRQARAAAGDTASETTFFVADITEWSPPHQFDLMAYTYALPTAGDQRDQALATANAAVAPSGTLVVTEWDHSLANVAAWTPADRVSLTEIVGHLADLEVEKAELVQVYPSTMNVDVSHGHDEDHGDDGEEDGHTHRFGHDHAGGGKWVVALVRARRRAE